MNLTRGTTLGKRGRAGALCLAFFAALFNQGCDPKPEPAATQAEVHQLVAGANEFAMALFRPLARNPENMVFSPYGIHEALALAGGGANGATAQEFRTLLRTTLPEGRAFQAYRALDTQLETSAGWAKRGTPTTVRLANALWVDRILDLKKDFRAKAQAGFRATVETVDFEAAPQEAMRRINEAVSRGTEGNIPVILTELPRLTRVVLTNAVYVKGGWDLTFEESRTLPGPFTPLQGGKATTPLMHGCAAYSWATVDGCQALGMDFKEGPLRMVVLLPERAHFKAFEEELTAERLWKILGSLRSNGDEFLVDVTMPKFKFEMDSPVKDAIQSLGLSQAFTPGADFSRLSGRPLMIDKFVHRATITVNEKGAEAAAVTSMPGVELSDPDSAKPKIIPFKADHPFVFLIQDRESGVILFMGHYMHP